MSRYGQNAASVDLLPVFDAVLAAAGPAESFDALATGLRGFGFDQINYGYFDQAAAERENAKALFLSATSPSGRQPDTTARWQAQSESPPDFGLTQINYAFLDFESASRMEARGDPAMSTIRRGWIEHYTARHWDLRDDTVFHVRQGNVHPMLWSLEQIPHPKSGQMNDEAGEAGLKAGLLVPLAGPAGSDLPAAAIMLGSGLGEAEFLRLIGSSGISLVSLAHLFHAGAVGELIRRRHNIPPLSQRERDCIQLIARGLRVDAIGDQLAIARVTVELHLRTARQKLGAKTTPEAVARALLYRQINPM